MNGLRDKLIDAISEEIRRVFPTGFLGDEDQYDWLLACYSVTEEDDIRWQCILSDEGLDALDLDKFLKLLLMKYQSNVLVYPGPIPTYKAPAA